MVFYYVKISFETISRGYLTFPKTIPKSISALQCYMIAGQRQIICLRNMLIICSYVREPSQGSMSVPALKPENLYKPHGSVAFCLMSFHSPKVARLNPRWGNATVPLSKMLENKLQMVIKLLQKRVASQQCKTTECSSNFSSWVFLRKLLHSLFSSLKKIKVSLKPCINIKHKQLQIIYFFLSSFFVHVMYKMFFTASAFKVNSWIPKYPLALISIRIVKLFGNFFIN